MTGNGKRLSRAELLTERDQRNYREWEAKEQARFLAERDVAKASGAAWADFLPGFESIEPGAPRPHVFGNAHKVVLVYSPTSRGPARLVMFDFVRFVSLGYPSEDALEGHPLYGSGLRRFHVHEVFNSELIAGLEERNRVHPHHRPEVFTESRHVLFAFHDRTFDCVCRSWRTYMTEAPFKDVLLMATDALISGELSGPGVGDE